MKNSHLFYGSLLVFTLLLRVNTFAQFPGGGEANPQLLTHVEALRSFQDNKFGMFIHWGPVSLRGVEISWARGKEVAIEDYDNLYKEFNPVLFDAESWVHCTKEAGMKYLVITAKHHDGFCLWDSKYTDYDIMSTPFKRDVVKELAEACEKGGIGFCIYYSIADWSHPHYATRYGGDPRPVELSDMNIYFQYMKDQLKELIDNFHPAMIWFDGGWEEAYTHEMGMELYAYLRSLQDDLLINNRVDKGFTGMDGKTKSRAKYAGDFETPEQQVGTFNLDYPWETCMTICKQWAWKPNDEMKSLKDCLHTLLKTVGGGGNFLFNVGPMLDGRIEQRQADRLKEMGDWLKINGEAIYGSKGGPYPPSEKMVSTRKGNKIFLHMLSHPGPDFKLTFPANFKIQKAFFLESNKEIAYKKSKKYIQFDLPETLPDDNALIIVLELDKSAMKIAVIR